VGTFLEDKDRNVIPRLRSFRTTLALGELNSAIAVEDCFSSQEEKHSLLSKIVAWKKSRTISFAADLVSAAFVFQEPEEAREAAESILAKGSEAPKASRTIAERLLESLSTPSRQVRSLPELILPEPDDIRARIGTIRKRLGDEPRNAILWVELSRAFALLGLEAKAGRAMDIAVDLAPTNRFVLRSASRLYIHLGRHGKAHSVLERAKSTKYDPWLLSAEIAASSAADRRSRLIGTGQKMLKDQSIAPFQKNELASAIATLELSNGKVQSARSLFRQALQNPNENSVAQAEWALRRKHMDSVEVDLDRVRDVTPRSFEARAWVHFMTKEWKPAFLASFDWLKDQPFSIRPVLFGSYIAASLLDDYSDCQRIIKIGLRANPDEPMLLNNLAFACASAGDIDEAERYFRKIDLSKTKDATDKIAITATQGLLLFRRGHASAGRSFYQLAIEEARKISLDRASAMASIYLAREEILSGSKWADNAMRFATEEYQRTSDPDIKEILRRVQDLNERTAKKKTISGNSTR